MAPPGERTIEPPEDERLEESGTPCWAPPGEGPAVPWTATVTERETQT